MPEIGFDERFGFNLVVNTLDEATARAEAARCLQCDEICSVCVSVCPNRANIEFTMEPVSFKVQQAVQDPDGSTRIRNLQTEHITQKYQMLNIGDFCNECGNCATFCPTSGAPYKDKPKFHLTAASFDSARFGYRFTSENRMELKCDKQQGTLFIDPDGYTYEDGSIRVVLGPDYSARQVDFKNDAPQSVNLRQVARTAILAQAVRGLAPMGLNKQDRSRSARRKRDSR